MTTVSCLRLCVQITRDLHECWVLNAPLDYKTDEFHPPKIDWIADDKIYYKKFYRKATAEKTSPMLVVSIQTIKLIYMKKYNHRASWPALTSVTFIFVVLVSVLNQACRKMEVIPGNQA